MSKKKNAHLRSRPQVDSEHLPRHIAAQSVRKAKSLRPGVSLMEAYARGDEEARLIAESWIPKLPIRVVNRVDYAEMVAKQGGIVFHG